MIDKEWIKLYFLESVYEAHGNEVYRVCLHYAKDKHIAENMTQKTFVKFYEHLDRIQPGKTRAYLILTARNMTADYLRDFKRLREGQIDDLVEEKLKIISMEDVSIRKEKERFANELSRSILTRLYHKNKRWYDVIMMACYLDMPQEEIAEHLNIDVDVVYSRLYRAKRWIRKTYKEEYEKYFRDMEG